MKKLTVLLFVVLGTVSCATYTFTPLNQNGVSTETVRTRKHASFSTDMVQVVLAPSYVGNELAIEVFLKNSSGKGLTFKDTDFHVEISEDGANYVPVKTYTSDEFLKKETDEYIATMVLLAFSAAANTVSSKMNHGYTSGQVAQLENYMQLSSAEQSGEGWLQYLKDNLFFQKTIQPNGEYSGLIFTEKEIKAKHMRCKIETAEITCATVEYIIKQDKYY